MTTSYTLTGNIKDVVGAGATAVKAAIGTNLGDVALVDIDGQAVHLPKRAPLAIANDGTFTTSLIATNSGGINISDGTLRYILYVSYRDAEGKRRDWDSGYFELVTNTDLSVVAGTDVAVEVSEATAMVTTLVEQAVQDHTPGIELGSASRTSAFTTTNITAGNGSLGLITGLTVTITGSGRPVDVRFTAPAVYHSVANTFVGVSINAGNPLAANNATFASSQSTLTNNGNALEATLRTATLNDGQSYTFQVNVWGAAAGTSTLAAAAYGPIQLVVTSR